MSDMMMADHILSYTQRQNFNAFEEEQKQQLLAIEKQNEAIQDDLSHQFKESEASMMNSDKFIKKFENMVADP